MWNPISGVSTFDPYVVNWQPDIPGVSSLHVGVGGYVNGALRMTGRFYYPFMFPGGLDENGMPPADSIGCSIADRIYTVRAADFKSEVPESFPESVYDWPAALGAPVIDGDGIIGNYDVLAGDRPALIGESIAWWKMNDGGRLNLVDSPLGYEHVRNVGIEVEVLTASIPVGRRLDMTISRYTLRYAGAEALEDAVLYLFTETGASHRGGSFASDSMTGLGYGYFLPDHPRFNNDAPALGVQVLRGPTVDDDAVDNNNDSFIDEPGEELRPTMISGFSELNEQAGDGNAYDTALTGCWSGTEMIEEVGCYNKANKGAKRARFWSAYDPIEKRWESENSPSKRYLMISMGPFTWQPGTKKTIEFATLWVQGASSLDSAHLIRHYARSLMTVRDDLFVPSIPDSDPVQTTGLANYSVSDPHPNPAFNLIRFAVELPSDDSVEIRLVDVQGREVLKQVVFLGAGAHELQLDTSAISSGVYFYRVAIRTAVRTGSVVIAK